MDVRLDRFQYLIRDIKVALLTSNESSKRQIRNECLSYLSADFRCRLIGWIPSKDPQVNQASCFKLPALPLCHEAIYSTTSKVTASTESTL
ncbi:hypothetical protein QQF64_006726 [Cirrhinus molitorella]|uniref:Uncharacterized protein n=1 Tax=Cirrhinus molitorella TaxID=172907 RepID=A0ABR3MB24_9TELE